MIYNLNIKKGDSPLVNVWCLGHKFNVFSLESINVLCGMNSNILYMYFCFSLQDLNTIPSLIVRSICIHININQFSIQSTSLKDHFLLLQSDQQVEKAGDD